MNDTLFSEKQEYEKNIAEIFLGKYNQRMHTEYEIHELKEPEDVI